MKIIIILLIILTSCSTTGYLNYNDPEAAVFQLEKTLIVRFKGSSPHICKLIDKDGNYVGEFLAIKDETKINLETYIGEYNIVVYNSIGKMVCIKEIFLK